MNDPATPQMQMFHIDQSQLSACFDRNENHPYRLDAYGETPAEAIAGFVREAERADAFRPPANTQLDILCITAASVVLVIRDSVQERPGGRASAGLPRERQVASWHIETRSLAEGSDTFEQLRGTLENICREANALLPALTALIDGETRVLDVIGKPLRVLTYNNRGRLGMYMTSVPDLTEWDADLGCSLWPLLIETLETGEATEDWDGERQRGLQLRYGGAPHLARQLLDLRRVLAEHGVRDLAKADPPLHTYLP